jgi:DNA polymerase (family 10)
VPGRARAGTILAYAHVKSTLGVSMHRVLCMLMGPPPASPSGILWNSSRSYADGVTRVHSLCRRLDGTQLALFPKGWPHEHFTAANEQAVRLADIASTGLGSPGAVPRRPNDAVDVFPHAPRGLCAAGMGRQRGGCGYNSGGDMKGVVMAETVNLEIAQRLEEVADLLDEQGANPYRVQAYRNAAQTLPRLDRPVTEILQRHGMDGLRQLPGIGESLAHSIHALATTGRLPMLERLWGESDPVALLASVSGIGKVLATRLHEDLGIDTLEELEEAAYDGRLSQIARFGKKKLETIRESLAARLGRVQGQVRWSATDEPAIEELLDVDREYREKTAAGRLRRIAPQRFNPSGEAWLPVLHSQRGERHYTALFSNTARAHQMDMTGDWVVLYYDGGGEERQYTVITSQHGALKGKRIVRGREVECVEYYQQQKLPVT